jgi:hypothetical protein
MENFISIIVRKIKNILFLLRKKCSSNYRDDDEKGFGVQGIDMFY